MKRRRLVALAVAAAALLFLALYLLHRSGEGVRGQVARTPSVERDETHAPLPVAKPVAPRAAPLDEADLVAIPLRGIVVDVAGQPVPQALVRVKRVDPRLEYGDPARETPFKELETDSAGEFSLTGELGDFVGIAASKEGFATARRRCVSLPARLRLVLAAGKWLEIYVKEEGDLPVAGARVSCLTHQLILPGLDDYEGAREDEVTDEAGRALFGGLGGRGTVTLLVEHPLFERPIELPEAELDDSPRKRVTIYVKRAVIATGSVCDAATGAPVSGARVGIGPLFYFETRTDAEGAFTVGGLPCEPAEPTSIHVHAKGYATARLPWGRGTQSPLEVRLRGGARVFGRFVADGDAGELRGREVILRGIARDELGGDIETLTTQTLPDGSWEIIGLREELRYAVFVKVGGGSLFVTDVPGDGLEDVDLGTLRLPEPARLTARVTYSDGSPAGSLRVQVSATAESERVMRRLSTKPLRVVFGLDSMTTTDARGCLALEGISPGSYELTVREREFTWRQESTANGLRRVEVVLPWAAEHMVYLAGPWERVRHSQRVVGETSTKPIEAWFHWRGRMRLRLTAGQVLHAVVVYGVTESGTAAMTRVDVEPESAFTVVHLTDDARITGQVVDSASAPVAKALVQFLDDGQLRLVATADGEGRFAATFGGQIGGLMDLEWMGAVAGVKALHAEYAFRRNVTIGSENILLVARPRDRSQSLTVRIEDADGKGVAHAHLIVSPAFVPGAIADDRGVVELAGLPALEVQLIAASPDRGTAESMTVVPGGQTVVLRMPRPK